jgi:hypothetical protein
MVKTVARMVLPRLAGVYLRRRASVKGIWSRVLKNYCGEPPAALRGIRNLG